ncbi:glutaredoxin 3, partial [Phenoliferia sp. Uapishka_3]
MLPYLAIVAATLGLASALQIDVTHLPTTCTTKSAKGDKLSMHYTGTPNSPPFHRYAQKLKRDLTVGTLDDGSTFDSSRTRNSAFDFTLGIGQVIKGWDQGLLDMCVGEKRILTIEPELGYGVNGYPPIIPGNSVLTFDVELLNIGSKPKPKPAAPAPATKKFDTIKEAVEDAIKSNHIMIFSKSYCPYCKRAKALIGGIKPKKGGREAHVMELDLMGEEGSAVQAYLLERTGQRSVPNIFIGQQHLGGADAVAALHSEGKLAELVAGKDDLQKYLYGAGLVGALLSVGVVLFRFMSSGTAVGTAGTPVPLTKKE